MGGEGRKDPNKSVHVFPDKKTKQKNKKKTKTRIILTCFLFLWPSRPPYSINGLGPILHLKKIVEKNRGRK